MILLFGLIFGLILGLLLNWQVPQGFAVYLAVAALSALHALLQALADLYEERFDSRYYLLSFLGNTLFAMCICALGEQLKIPLSYVPFFAFGNRMFNCLNRIWKQVLVRHTKEGREYRQEP